MDANDASEDLLDPNAEYEGGKRESKEKDLKDKKEIDLLLTGSVSGAVDSEARSSTVSLGMGSSSVNIAERSGDFEVVPRMRGRLPDAVFKSSVMT